MWFEFITFKLNAKSSCLVFQIDLILYSNCKTWFLIQECLMYESQVMKNCRQLNVDSFHYGWFELT